MIHYHGCPLSGDTVTQMALRGRHAMVSYAAPDTLQLAAEICQSFALDNGAFSAWTRGEALDAPGYWRWASDWSRHPGFDWCLIPDVIDGSESDNDALLVDAPSVHWCVPVWHLHESIERLERLAADWPRVAFGSSGQFATPGSPSWWERMSQAMHVVCDSEGRPAVKLHGLRMLDTAITSEVPLSSADSTNVARNIGIDKRWTGPYVPPSKDARAIILMDRIESHAVASRWTGHRGRNFELFG